MGNRTTVTPMVAMGFDVDDLIELRAYLDITDQELTDLLNSLERRKKMKIIKDGNGKHIIDFEGLEIDVDLCCCCIGSLFNSDYVSKIMGGHFICPQKSVDNDCVVSIKK